MVLEWLFKPKEHRGLIMGMDASGKTTLLYQLKLGECVTTIPTISFNVETITHPKGSTLTLWDVGGCDKIRPLLPHYIQPGDFIIFIHDCSDDEERQDESVDFLCWSIERLIHYGCKYLWVVMNKQDLLPVDTLVPVIEEKCARYERFLRAHQRDLEYKVLRLPGFSIRTGDRLDYLVDDIRRTLAGKASLPPPQTPPIAREPTTEELTDRIREAHREMESAATFWRSFLDAKMRSWDHFTHLRAGYTVLLEGPALGQSVLTCADIFIDHLERLRSARPDMFRNTAHKTMTAFWLFQIRFATHKYQIDTGAEKVPSLEAFAAVLLHTPHLMNTGLWKKYYTKDLLFSPKAREAWCFPDLKPLPTTLPEAATTAQAPAVQAPAVPAPDRLLRFAFIVVQKVPMSRRRGELVNHALEALKSSTIRARAKNPAIPPYSVTQAYFWIQIFHHARVSLEQGNIPGLPARISALNFDTFKEMLELDGEEWRRHYSPGLWDGIPARMEFQLPDLAPLPNALVAPTTANIESARAKMLESFYSKASHTYEVPPEEDLVPMAAILVCEAGAFDAAAGEVKTHAALIAHLYTELVSDLKAKDDHGGTDDEKPQGTVQRSSSRALSVALGIPGPYVSGTTAKMFWVQQVVAAEARADASRTASFSEFVNGVPHLAYEQLPLVYYSTELWESQEAAEMFVPPDVRPFTNFV